MYCRVMPTPPRHQIVLGTTAEGAAVALPGSGLNVMITGEDQYHLEPETPGEPSGPCH